MLNARRLVLHHFIDESAHKDPTREAFRFEGAGIDVRRARASVGPARRRSDRGGSRSWRSRRHLHEQGPRTAGGAVRDSEGRRGVRADRSLRASLTHPVHRRGLRCTPPDHERVTRAPDVGACRRSADAANGDRRARAGYSDIVPEPALGIARPCGHAPTRCSSERAGSGIRHVHLRLDRSAEGVDAYARQRSRATRGSLRRPTALPQTTVLATTRRFTSTCRRSIT